MSASIRCSGVEVPSRDCSIGDCLDHAVDGTGVTGVRRGGQEGEYSTITGASVQVESASVTAPA